MVGARKHSLCQTSFQIWKSFLEYLFWNLDKARKNSGKVFNLENMVSKRDAGRAENIHTVRKVFKSGKSGKVFWIFFNLDKSGKLFKSENMVNKRDMTEEFSKLEEDKPKKHLHFIQNIHNTST